MALSFDDDPSGLLYPGAMPSGYQLPVSSFEDEAQEELFRQAMTPQEIMPADPVPYPEPEPLAVGSTLGPRGRGTPTTQIAKQIPYSQDARGKLRIGETGEAQPDEVAGPGTPAYAPEGEPITAPPVFVGDGEAGLAAGGVTPEGDAGIEIDQPGLAAGGVTPEGDAGIEIEGEGLPPPPPTETTAENYYRLLALAKAPRDGTVDPAQIDHAQTLLGWLDDKGEVTKQSPFFDENKLTQEELNRKYRGESAQENFERREKDRLAAQAEEKRRLDEIRDNQIKARDQGDRIYDEARASAKRDRDRNQLEARELASREIDPGRWWNTRGTGQKIAALLGAIAGGLLEARGGKNHALPMLQQMMQDDVDAQKANIANKRALLGDEEKSIGQRLADADEDHRIGSARMQANYEILKGNVAEYMQNFNPRGAQAQRFREFMQAIDRDAAKAADEAEKQSAEWKIKIGDYNIRAQDAENRRKAADAAAAKARAAAAASASSGEKLTPDQWVAWQASPSALRPPRDMNKKEFDDWMEQQTKLNKLKGDKSEAQIRKEEAEATKAEAEASAFKGGFQINNPDTAKPFVDANGDPIAIKNDTQRNELISALEAAKRLRRLADRMAQIKEKDGGNWKVLGSDEAQELESLRSAVDFTTFKAFGLGAPSEGDKELAVGGRGGVDPSSFVRDATKGLQTYADQVEKMANDKLRLAGFAGKFRLARLSDLPQAKDDYIDEIGKRLTTSLTAPATPSGNPIKAAQHQIRAAFAPELKKRTDEDLQALAAHAENAASPEDRKRVRTLLEGLAAKAVDPDTRKRVKKIIDDLPGGNERTDKAR
jgi:hypothetical protein